MNQKSSLREVPQFVSGVLTANTFQNPFLRALKLGHTIQSVTLTHVPDADDDMLEFTFAPDAAVGKIVAKEPASTE